MNRTHTLQITLGALLVAVSAASMAEMTPSREDRMDAALQNYRTKQTEPSTLDRAGNSVERGAKKTGHAVKHGAKKTEAAVGRGMEKTGDAIENTGEKMQNKANKADH